MGNVIDVSESGKPESAVLTSTATSGILGSTFLHSEPLSTYLGESERAQYVLRNKRTGLRIESDGGGDWSGDGDRDGETEQLTPASDYQALAAVTDVRIVFVVGTPDGDRSTSIQLADVATVAADGGLLGGELSITTASDVRYVFSCRGDLDPIVEYVDRGSQAWARAYTYLETARDALSVAEDARDATDFRAAIAAIDEGTTALTAARDRLATFGSGAERSLAPEAEELDGTLEQRRRAIHAEHGVHAHERGHRHWGNREYERAHQAYREATAALERAQDLAETADVEDRLARIDEELDELADAPLTYASAMVEEARASDDPRTCAQCWEVAIERYRDAYALDWGRDDDRFRGDPVRIRERILDAIDSLVDHRVDGIERRLEEAEWLRQSDDIAGARDVLEETMAALDRTERLVDELTVAEYPELDEARVEIEADLTLLPGE